MEKQKKMRVDKRKNIEKVIKEKIKNPLATTREIAKKTGVSKSAVADHVQNNLDKIGQKDERIMLLTDKDFDIVKLAQQRIEEKLMDEAEMKKTRIGEISAVAKDSAARYTIFRWELTDAEWWGKVEIISFKDILNG